jgi:hypothetical protein
MGGNGARWGQQTTRQISPSDNFVRKMQESPRAVEASARGDQRPQRYYNLRKKLLWE